MVDLPVLPWRLVRKLILPRASGDWVAWNVVHGEVGLEKTLAAAPLRRVDQRELAEDERRLRLMCAAPRLRDALRTLEATADVEARCVLSGLFWDALADAGALLAELEGPNDG